jgi:hypothetical protein
MDGRFTSLWRRPVRADRAAAGRRSRFARCQPSILDCQGTCGRRVRRTAKRSRQARWSPVSRFVNAVTLRPCINGGDAAVRPAGCRDPRRGRHGGAAGDAGTASPPSPPRPWTPPAGFAEVAPVQPGDETRVSRSAAKASHRRGSMTGRGATGYACGLDVRLARSPKWRCRPWLAIRGSAHAIRDKGVLRPRR